LRTSSNSVMTDKQAIVFGQELARLRKEHGLTGAALGELAECSAVHISAMETGKKKPSPQLAERIADVFDLKVSDMLTPYDERVREIRQKYGATLREHRRKKGLSPNVIAGALGIPNSVYTEYEQGDCSITDREMDILIKLLDIGKEPEVVVETKTVEPPAEIPTDICALILGHIKDLQIGEDSQKKVWRYFMDTKAAAEERRLFG